MRDHLLGCQAYMPPEDDGLTRHQRPFALGIPERMHVEHRARYAEAAAEQLRLAESVFAEYLAGNFDDMVREANAQTCSNAKPPENKTASGLCMLMDASRKIEERWNDSLLRLKLNSFL